jgi:hypothetical protein
MSKTDFVQFSDSFTGTVNPFSNIPVANFYGSKNGVDNAIWYNGTFILPDETFITWTSSGGYLIPASDPFIPDFITSPWMFMFPGVTSGSPIGLSPGWAAYTKAYVEAKVGPISGGTAYGDYFPYANKMPNFIETELVVNFDDYVIGDIAPLLVYYMSEGIQLNSAGDDPASGDGTVGLTVAGGHDLDGNYDSGNYTLFSFSFGQTNLITYWVQETGSPITASAMFKNGKMSFSVDAPVAKTRRYSEGLLTFSTGYNSADMQIDDIGREKQYLCPIGFTGGFNSFGFGVKIDSIQQRMGRLGGGWRVGVV